MTKRIVIVLSMLLLIVAGAWAQDYDPQNPPDPNAYFKLTVSASPAEAGYVSGGSKYKEGQQVWISTSAYTNYDFLYWTCDGVQISTERNFYYTMPNKAVTLVAVYAFNPRSPADPTATAYSYRLYLNTNMEGSCTFNLTSGAKQQAGQYISVSAQNVSPGFKFQGWYLNDELINENLSFWYKMPTNDATLTAHFEYNPDNPDDPSSNQTNVDQHAYVLGDANKDGSVTIGDIVAVVNIIAGSTGSYNLNAADANQDGTISVGDIVTIVNIISGNY